MDLWRFPIIWFIYLTWTEGSFGKGYLDDVVNKSLPVEDGLNFQPTRLNQQILESIKDISVLVSSSDDFISNRFVHFLMHKPNVALTLAVRKDDDGQYIFESNQRHRCVLMENARLIEKTLQRHARRSVLLLCVFKQALEKELIVKVAHQMWITQGILKVYYISNSEIVFYNPFAWRTDGNYGALVNADEHLHTDIFTNMNGYTMRTYIFDSVYSMVYGDAESKRVSRATGADSNTAMLLAALMNFTIDFQIPDGEYFGARLDNGSYNGAIGRMIRYETDLTMAGFFVKDYLTRDIEFSVGVYMDELCCYVMKAKRIPQSIVPLFAVDLYIWLSFLITGMLCPIVWMMIRQLNLRMHIKTMVNARKQDFGRFQYVRIFIDTWVVWVRVNIINFPPFNSERIFIISLCLVSVIFGALFESSLATVYIRPLYYKDIDSMAALDEANFRIYIKHAAIKDDLFYGHPSEVYMNLDRKVILVAESDERLIEMMSARGGFAAVTRAASLYLNDIRYVITKKVHLISECPKKYHIAFVAPAQSPYLEQVNAWLLQFLAGGHILHWIDEMKHKAKISMHNFPDYIAEQAHNWKILTLKDLQLSFYALLAGSMTASVCLLCEFALAQYRSRKTKI